MTPRYACIYTRLSYAPDGSVEKVERQDSDCRDLAGRINWGICCVYTDNNKSAWQKNRKRRGWDAMLESFDPGAVCPKGNKHDGILVYHGDRLIRQPWDLELLLKIADDRRIPLASPSGTRDLSNEDDRYILRIEAAGFCRSSADTSRRVRRGIGTRVENGRPAGGGNRPFGYGISTGKTGTTGKPLYDLTKQNPEEAAVLAQAVERLLAGQTLGGVLAWMNQVSTSTEGNRWESRSLKQVLLAPRIAGLIEHDGDLHAGQWEGIITPEAWEDVKSLLQHNSTTYGYPGRERRYLQTGTAECSGCGHTLHAKPAGGRNRKTARLYYCKNPACTQKVSRNVEHLDEYVVGRVLRRLNEPGFLAAVHADTEQPGVGAEITALERRKAEAKATLEELADHPDVDPALLVKSLASFDRKIRQLRGQLAATAEQRLLARMAGVTRAQWDAEPIDVRAETVRALFRVTVLPVGRRGPGFDPASVRVERR